MQDRNREERLSRWLGRMADVVRSDDSGQGIQPAEVSRAVRSFYRMVEERDVEQRTVFRAGVFAVSFSLALFVFSGAHDEYLDDLAQLELEQEAIESVY